VGAPPEWQPVDGPPDPCLGFGLLPLEDLDGSARRVMLLVWRLDERGAALVQPIIRGQDQPLPWGLRTRAHDPPPGGRPEDGVSGYADHVVPMVMAVEAMLQKGITPQQLEGRMPEALRIARMAGAGRRDVTRMAGGGPQHGR